MKTILSILFCLPVMAFAQSGDVTGGRHYTDPNASINKTDFPRNLNQNNSTNSTAGDHLRPGDKPSKAVPTKVTVTSQPETPSNKPAGIVKGESTPDEGKAQDKLVNKGKAKAKKPGERNSKPKK